VYIHNGAGGLLAENEIYANAKPGVRITTGASPLVERNHIYGGKDSGVCVAVRFCERRASGGFFLVLSLWVYCVRRSATHRLTD
jgi:hypothetical protein